MLKNGSDLNFASIKSLSMISVIRICGFHQNEQQKMTVMVFCWKTPPVPKGRRNFLFSLGKNALITRACRLSAFLVQKGHHKKMSPSATLLPKGLKTLFPSTACASNIVTASSQNIFWTPKSPYSVLPKGTRRGVPGLRWVPGKVIV